jgi:hypothetical protein
MIPITAANNKPFKIHKMKKNIKPTPIIMDDSEVQILLERWQRGVQSNREILSDLYPADNPQEFNRVTECLAYSEDRLSYWINVQEKRERTAKDSIAKNLHRSVVRKGRKSKNGLAMSANKTSNAREKEDSNH